MIDVVAGSGRHIVSTTLTTFGGFLPLIVAGGAFWPPFAMVIAGGVLLSTMVSFRFVPAGVRARRAQALPCRSRRLLERLAAGTGSARLIRTGEPVYMLYACNHHLYMGTMIQIRIVPEDIHRTLKSRAALEGLSLSDYLLREIRVLATHPSPAELRARLSSRPGTRTGESMAEAVRAERDTR